MKGLIDFVVIVLEENGDGFIVELYKALFILLGFFGLLYLLLIIGGLVI